MKIDDFEPTDIELLLKQAIPEVIRAPLNANGFADYQWLMYTGRGEHVERKQVNEILSDMPHVEEQLRGHLENQPDHILWLLVEGIITPHDVDPRRTVIYAKRSKSAEVFVPIRDFGMPFERFEGFLTSLERTGVRVRRTVDYYATARVLAHMETSAQRPHTVLQRHIKPRITFKPNAQVMTLLGAHKSGIGPELAENLIKVYGNVAAIIRTTPEEIADSVPGVGLKKAKQLLEAFGA